MHKKNIPSLKPNLIFPLGLLLFSAMPAFAEDNHSGHDHSKHDDSKLDHPKEDSSKHDHKGPAHELKPLIIGDLSIKTELIGEIESGKSVELHISISKKSSIKMIRSWIGIKNGQGSRKKLLEKEGELDFYGKIEVPSDIRGELELWYDMTLADGSQKIVSLELPDDHKKGDDHKGHNH